MEMEDGDLFSDLMFQNTGRRTHSSRAPTGGQCAAGATGPGECHAGGRAGYQPGGADLRHPAAAGQDAVTARAAPSEWSPSTSPTSPGRTSWPPWWYSVDGRPHEKRLQAVQAWRGWRIRTTTPPWPRWCTADSCITRQGDARLCPGSGSVADRRRHHPRRDRQAGRWRPWSWTFLCSAW